MPSRKSSILPGGRKKPKASVPGVSGRKTGTETKRFIKQGTISADVDQWFAESSDEESRNPTPRSKSKRKQDENKRWNLNKEINTSLIEEDAAGGFPLQSFSSPFALPEEGSFSKDMDLTEAENVYQSKSSTDYLNQSAETDILPELAEDSVEKSIESIEVAEADLHEETEPEVKEESRQQHLNEEVEADRSSAELGDESLISQDISPETQDEMSMIEDDTNNDENVEGPNETEVEYAEEQHEIQTPAIKTKTVRSVRIEPSPAVQTPVNRRKSSLRRSISSTVEVPQPDSSSRKSRRKSVTFHADLSINEDNVGSQQEDEQCQAIDIVEHEPADIATEHFSSGDDAAEDHGSYEEENVEEQHASSPSDPEVHAPSTSQAPNKGKAKARGPRHPIALREQTNLQRFYGLPSAGLKEVQTDSGDIVRRSNRQKIAPLEYWRNEYVKYGRRKSGFCPVPVMQEIIRVEKEGSGSEATGSSKRKKQKRASDSKHSVNPMVKYVDPKSEEPTEKQLVMDITDISWNNIHNSDYKMSSTISDPTNTSIYSGFLHFEKDGEKPLRESGDVSMMCYVVQGTLEVTIHESTFVAHKGVSFCIPKGNEYKMKNIGSGAAKIYYVNDRSAKKKKTKDQRPNESTA